MSGICVDGTSTIDFTQLSLEVSKSEAHLASVLFRQSLDGLLIGCPGVGHAVEIGNALNVDVKHLKR